MTISVDDLAQEIRRVDGGHDLGAGALAEALMPFIATRLREPAETRECKCDMRTKLVGDGCDVCNPEYAAQFADYLADAQAQGGGEVVAWRREWQGSGPQRGFHIREDVHLHNNRVVAYLGDQVDGDEVDKLIAAHNGKHPNGDPVRTAPPSGETKPAGWMDPDDLEHFRFAGDYCIDVYEKQPCSAYVPFYLAPPSAPVGVTPECLSALRSYQQADAEGVMVTVSRQALDEVIAALAQQPAAVDEAMVERALAAYLRRQEDGESLYGCVTAALTAALAGQQPGGSDNDR